MAVALGSGALVQMNETNCHTSAPGQFWIHEKTFYAVFSIEKKPVESCFLNNLINRVKIPLLMVVGLLTN